MLGGGLISLGASESGTVDSALDRLPVNVDSTKVVELQAQLPKSETLGALVVYAPSESATFTPAQLQDLAGIGAQLQNFGVATPGLPPVIPSETLNVAITSVTFEATENIEELSDTVKEMREFIADSELAGIDIYVSGEAGISTDLASVFDGANFTLLAVTASVVALLLLITYRSPVLWILPLIVVGLADRAGVTLALNIGEWTGVPMDESVPGIVSVLIFGAGTDYALLLIARYRDELRLVENKYEAMRIALTKSFEPIGASASTVILALVTLLLSAFPATRGLGLAGAVGVLTAMVFALFVLPPFLVLFGRKAFWPLIPKVGDKLSADRAGIWGRVGGLVRKRPAAVLAAGIGTLLIASSGLLQVNLGLSQNEQFLDQPESIAGLEVLSQGFAGGTSDPIVVLTTPAQAAAVEISLRQVPEVVDVTPGAATTEVAQLNVVTKAISGTDAAEADIAILRDALANYSETYVGGTTAEQVDRNASILRDWLLIVPIVLILVLAVLIWLLKSVLAPVLLVFTVVGNFLASLGLSWLIFTEVFGFVGLESGVPLLAFLFLVALGVDYNIFLVTRAREDAQTLGTAEGMLRALASTGGVITSAGVLLAAVFAVLGVLPLVTLTQIGVIVCVGVLLDTLLVRTIIVPALGVLLAEKFWWPGAILRTEK
jgi:RND superfamily putative drug exporter